MSKRVVVVGVGEPAQELARRLEGATLAPAQAAALPACELAVLLGDPSAQGGHEELLRRNGEWVRRAAAAAGRWGAVIICACRPVNVLALAALRAAGGPRERVLGTGGMTDALRLGRLLGEAAGVGAGEVRALALGGCGEDLVVSRRFCSIAGVPAEELLSRDELSRILACVRTAAGAEELVAAGAELGEAVLGGRRRLLPCSAYLEGEYGVQGVFLAVPARLGIRGVERIVQLNLSVAERVALHKAASAGRALRALLEVTS